MFRIMIVAFAWLVSTIAAAIRGYRIIVIQLDRRAVCVFLKLCNYFFGCAYGCWLFVIRYLRRVFYTVTIFGRSFALIQDGFQTGDLLNDPIALIGIFAFFIQPEERYGFLQLL